MRVSVRGSVSVGGITECDPTFRGEEQKEEKRERRTLDPQTSRDERRPKKQDPPGRILTEQSINSSI